MALNEQETYSPERQRWTILVVSIASFMVGLDVLVVMTALPTLRVDLGANVTDLGWTINAYEIGFAALILTGSALGDRYGRRLLFLIGIGVFTVCSMWGALSSSIEMLIAARAFQGMGGGIATALALALVSAATPPEKRGAAFGIWGAVTGMAVALGPLVGGAIVQELAWQWIFWLNVPIGVVLILVGLARIDESEGTAQPIDFPGLVLSTGGVVAVAQALLRGGDAGWTTPSVLFGIIGGVVALIAFLVWEHRSPAPMMPLSMFRNRSFTGGVGASFTLGAALYGNAFMFAQFLQVAEGNDALGVGIRLLPWVSLAPFVAPIAGYLTDRIGERPLVITGFVLFAGAFFVIGPLALSGATYGTLIIPLFFAGIGVAMSYVTVVSAVMRSVDAERFGIASGVANTVRQVGAVFGVAVAVAVFSSVGGFRSPGDFVDGFGPAVIVLAVVTLLGVVPALVISPFAALAKARAVPQTDSVHP
ncbi:MAG TPA: DHA2 family efflux MFS transporter permease subunit [Streptosporangiaceae bacterium]